MKEIVVLLLLMVSTSMMAKSIADVGDMITARV